MKLDLDYSAARGLSAVRYLRAITLAKGDPVGALAFAESQNWSDRGKITSAIRAAVDAVDSDTASAMFAPVANDLVELVMPATIVGQLPGLRRVPMNTRVMGQTAGGTGTWRGEGSAIAVTQAAFDSIGTLTPLTVAGIVVQTSELARLSNPASDAVLRRDLQRALADALNSAFISPSNSGSAGVKPASVTYPATPIPSTGSSIAQISADLQNVIEALLDAGGDLTASAWVMNPRTAAFLAGLRGSSGGPVYPEVSALGGRLLGLPVIVTKGMPIAATTAATTAIALVDGSGISYAEDGADLQAGHDATLEMDSAPSDGATAKISLWQENLVAWRGVLYVNWKIGRAGAAQYISGVTY